MNVGKIEPGNFIVINGKRIDLTEEQVKTLTGCSDEKTKLADVPTSKTFKIGNYEFFVLEQLGDETAILMKDLLEDDVEFGSNNNYGHWHRRR